MLLATSQQEASARALVACVIPTAPGVTETTFASEPDPVTHMIDSKVTGMANAARKMPITASLQSHDRRDGRKTRVAYLLGWERIAPPAFACAHSFLSWRQKIRPTTTIRKPPPASTRIVLTAWSSRPFRASSKEPGTERNR